MFRPHWLVSRLLPALLVLPLAACATPPNLLPVHAASAPQPAAASSSLAPTINYTCRVNSDCVIKNIGNCCGYYPACVNKHSPAAPSAVQAECKRRGMMSACGFPAIRSCRCAARHCVAVNAAASAFGPH